MRVRDLRWHILSCVVIIISYFAIAFCYYLPVRARAQDSMKVLGSEANRNTVALVEQTVTTAYNRFITGVEVDINDPLYVDSSIPQTGLTSKFLHIPDGENKIILAQYMKMNPQSENQDYYFYFLRVNEDQTTTVGCISLGQIVNSIYANGDKAFTTFFYAEDGTLYYSTLKDKYGLLQNVLGISEFTLLDNADTFCLIYSVEGQEGVLSGDKVFDFYLSTFIPITDPYLCIDWILQQALVFYIIGIVLLILMLVILILGCRTASKLLRVDRYGLEKNKAIVIRIDLKGNVIFTNRTFKQIFGIKKLENVLEIYDVATKENILESSKQGTVFECSMEINTGEVRYFQFTPISISQSYYLMGTDVTIDYLRREHLLQMSGKNEITNCDNAFALVNNYKHIIVNDASDIAFIEYNITKYEEIIGVFGRPSYNLLQNEILKLIQELFEGNLIYHMSDDKFMIVYPNIRLGEVIEKIEESLTRIKKPFQIKQNFIYAKCKVVVYNYKKEDPRNIELNTIREKLDLAYKNIADFITKDYVVYESAMDSIIEAGIELEKDLVQGLQNNEFRMYLQPQMDVKTSEVTGFEALIRWIHPKYIDKSPQEYIELAEQRGHMLDVGKFVITETFKLAKALEKYKVKISMNVSPIQLLQVGFVHSLFEEAKKLELNTNSIAIEITETFLMSNLQVMIEKIKLLKENGFQIHLDDFLTGYSSMAYLKDLPIDTIKIDREYIRYIENSKVHASIVKTICSLGASLDLDVICEGIETEEQLLLAKKFGAKTIQGFYIGKAMPYKDAVELLEKKIKK